MLVLGRKVGQSITIDKDIRIVVVSHRDGKVRIGIEAPRHLEIVRTELLDPNRGKKNGSQDSP